MVCICVVGKFLPTNISDLEIKYIMLFKINALLGNNFGNLCKWTLAVLILAGAVLFCFILVRNISGTACTCGKIQPIAESFYWEAFNTELSYCWLTLTSVKIFHVNRLGIWLLSQWGHFVDFIGFLQRRSKGCIMFQYITL